MKTKKVTIEGDLVKVVEEQIVKTTTLDEFLDVIVKETNISTPILPPYCRFYKKENNNTTIVIELPPSFRKINMSYGNTCEELCNNCDYLHKDYNKTVSGDNIRKFCIKSKQYNLPFPYIIIIITIADFINETDNKSEYDIKNMSLYFSPESIKDMSSKLYKAPLYNLYDSSTVCMGDMSDILYNKSYTFDSVIRNLITAFFESEFNKDLDSIVYEYQNNLPDSLFNDINTWATSSIEDVLEDDYLGAGILGDLL